MSITAKIRAVFAGSERLELRPPLRQHKARSHHQSKPLANAVLDKIRAKLGAARCMKETHRQHRGFSFQARLFSFSSRFSNSV
jgi:hypothetical protein